MPTFERVRANYSAFTGKTSRGLALAGLVFAAGVGLAAQAPAPASRCVSCHESQAGAPGWAHIASWERSRHKAASVGCHDCHSGDPGASNETRAHIGVFTPLQVHPNSPVRRARLPATCGRCHTGQYDAFRSTSHYVLLQRLDGMEMPTERAPTCATCHGNVGVRPSSATVERECRTCHGPGARQPVFERPGQISNVVANARRIRVQLEAARRLVSGVSDPMRKRGLEDGLAKVDAELSQALATLHSFVLERAERALASAERRLNAVYKDLGMP